MFSLLERAAVVVGRSVSCEILESHSPLLDELMIKRVGFWAFPQDVQRVKIFAKLSLTSDHEWQKGEQMANANKVVGIRQVGFMVTASVHIDDLEDVMVSVTFEKQRVTSSTCAVCPGTVWCQHIIAVVIYRIQNADKIPIYAPVTETLLTLSRDQLQKLLQYAIHDGSGAVLGNVFSRIDAIRDVTSDINVTQGAPDSTFGVDPEEKTHWDLVLDDLKRNLTLELKYGIYPETFDSSKREASKLSKEYIQKVITLIHNNEVEAAGEVLLAIGQTVFQAMEEAPDSFSLSTPKYFLHDVMNVWTKYIIYSTGEARKNMVETAVDFNKIAEVLSNYQKASLWAELPSIATDFQNCVTDVVDARQSAPFYEPICASLLADPPEQYRKLLEGSLLPCESGYCESIPVMLLRFEAFKQWNAMDSLKERALSRLGIAILVRLLQVTEQYSIMNPALSSMIENQESCDESDMSDSESSMEDNKEILPPSMDQSADNQRICDDLLHTDSHMEDYDYISQPTEFWEALRQLELDLEWKGLKVEFVNMDQKSSKIESGRQPPSPSLSKATKHTSSSSEDDEPPKKKRRLQKNDTFGDKEQPRPPLLSSVYEDKVEDITKEHLCYSLLHLCHVMYAVDAMFMLDDASKSVLMRASFRALEMSRFRTITDQESHPISTKEHEWLEDLENKVFEDLFKADCEHSDREIMRSICKEYVEKLLSYGVSVYGGGLPIKLFDLLTKCLPESDEDAQKLCLKTVCHSKTPLDTYTIPRRDPDSYSLHDYSRYHDKIVARYEDIMIRFMHRLSPGEEGEAHNSMLLQFLIHLGDVLDVQFLYSAFKALKNNKERLVTFQHKKACVALLIHFIIASNKDSSDSGAYFKALPSSMLYFLVSFSKDLGAVFLEIILPYWLELHQFYKGNDLQMLIDEIKSSCQAEGTSDDVAGMIDAFFSSTKLLHDESSCKLLTSFTLGDTHYLRCLETIKANADNYSFQALLYVAEMDQNRFSSDHQGHSSDIFTKEAYFFLKKALEIYKRKTAQCGCCGYGPCQREAAKIDLTWAFDCLVSTSAEVVARGTQFTDFLDLMEACFSHDPDTLVTFFKTVEKSEPLLNMSREKLGSKLLAAYRKHFDDKFKYGSHGSYARVLRDMSDACRYCRHYAINGRSEFADIINYIRSRHRGKKKLLKMMDLEFSSYTNKET